MSPRRDAWWGGAVVLIIAIVALRAGADRNAFGSGTGGWLHFAGWVLIVLASVAAAVAAVGIVVVTLGRRRLRAMREVHPGCDVVPAARTDEMRDAVRALSPTCATLRTWFVWAVHDQGLSLWQRTRKPTEHLVIPWRDVRTVQVIGLIVGRRRFDACSLVVQHSTGQVLHLPFLVRSAARPLFLAGAPEVDALAEMLRLRALHSADPDTEEVGE